jgi:cell division protein FtsI/penicillin-binding protein 2
MKYPTISRYNIIGGALTVAGLFIFVWMIQIQTSASAKEILKKAEGYNTVRKTFLPERGNIYDRWGHLMAGSSEVYELGVDMQSMVDPTTISLTVASVLGLDSNAVHQSLTVQDPKQPLMYVVLANNVTPDKIAELATLQEDAQKKRDAASDKQRASMPSLSGLIWSAHLQRSYPEKALGSTVLGFINFLDREKGTGYFGIEGYYNTQLAGSPVVMNVPTNPLEIKDVPNVKPGVSLVLTIDRDIQAMTEKIADKAMKDNDAQSATIVIMDPRNGEVLAMASTPRLDPNEYWNYGELFPSPTPFNRAVSQTYEPGSVFKVLTMAAALDSGAVTPDTEFLDTGVIYVGGIPIYNWDRGAWGPQNMTGCMQHSLNVCLAWVATQMGPSTFYDYLDRFGIGRTTGIDLAEENSWPLSVQGDPNWYPVNLGTNAFGQGLATTPIQMITAISAVANNKGVMMSPHVLKAVIDNGEQFTNPPQVIGNPIKAETARTLSEMLANSLEKESSIALVDGYRVAGKTGTAEIPGPGGYTTGLTNASFVGWGPVDDPRFIVYIWLEKPASSPWGSVVASPVFSEVVKNLVVLLDLPPDSVRQSLAAGQ